MARKSKAKFTMKGHTLPGINQKSETVNIEDGRSPSSAFQQSALKQTENPLTGYDAEYLASLSPKERKQLRKENVEELKALSNKEINELVKDENELYNLGNPKTYYNPYASVLNRSGVSVKGQTLKTPRTGIFSNLTKKQRKKKEAYLRTMARKRRADLSTGAMSREQMQEFIDAGIDPTTMGNE